MHIIVSADTVSTNAKYINIKLFMRRFNEHLRDVRLFIPSLQRITKFSFVTAGQQRHHRERGIARLSERLARAGEESK